MYELFEHTADVGIRVRAASLEELFADAARGLFSVIAANLAAVRPLEQVRLTIQGTSHEDLLFDWLDELLYTFSTKRILFAEFEVAFVPAGLTAVARGEPADPDRHGLHAEVKAVTYHGLKVQRTEGGWLAEAIVDI